MLMRIQYNTLEWLKLDTEQQLYVAGGIEHKIT